MKIATMKYLLLSVFICWNIYLKAQTKDSIHVAERLSFINYLVHCGQYEDANYVLDKMDTSTLSNTILIDSLYFLKGWNFYCLKMLDSSSTCLSRVKSALYSYHKAVFFNSFDQIFLGHYQQAVQILNAYTPDNINLTEVKSFELSGISLLKRDIPYFDSLSVNYHFSYFPIAKEEKNLMAYRDEIVNTHRRSPALAALMSAVIPGSGEIYAR